MRMILLNAALAAGLLTAAPAMTATLTIDITGVAGTGETTWTFGGTATAAADGVFGELVLPEGRPAISSQFDNVGDFVLDDNDNLVRDVLSGVATVSVDNGSGVISDTIERVFVDGDTSGNDDIAFDFDGPTLAFFLGDTVTFSGSLITGFDLNELSASGLPFAGTSSGLNGLNPAFSLTVTITESVQAVPLPAAGWMLLSAFAAAAGLRGSRRPGNASPDKG